MKNILYQIRIIKRAMKIMRACRKIHLDTIDRMDHLFDCCVARGIPGKLVDTYYRIAFEMLKRRLKKEPPLI